MYLINALVFDAEWAEKYPSSAILKDYDFANIDGIIKKVNMMVSEESRYIEFDNAAGFVKNYYGGKYSFAAILPDEDVNLNDFIKGLSGEKFIGAMKNAKNYGVNAYLPAFEYEYKTEMSKALSGLGMPTAFNSGKADLSRLGRSTNGNLYVGNVIHKTYIKVDASGTKAGAVTRVDIKDESAPAKSLILNRPFLYVILDNATNLPVFIGTVVDFK